MLRWSKHSDPALFKVSLNLEPINNTSSPKQWCDFMLLPDFSIFVHIYLYTQQGIYA